MRPWATPAPGPRRCGGSWATAGFFALRLAEEAAESASGPPEAVLVFEEAGRALLPGPLVATHLAAGTVDGRRDRGDVW